MNYLAHIALSPSEDQSIGNFIADFLTLKQMKMLDNRYDSGLRLHREIDSFTDQHPIVKGMLPIFYPTQGKYATVVLDILFDHILAIQFETLHGQKLDVFAAQTYQTFRKHQSTFEEFAIWDGIQRMISHDFLYNYKNPQSIQYVLERMDQRTKFPSRFSEAMQPFLANLDQIEREFLKFYEELKEHVALHTA